MTFERHSRSSAVSPLDRLLRLPIQFSIAVFFFNARTAFDVLFTSGQAYPHSFDCPNSPNSSTQCPDKYFGRSLTHTLRVHVNTFYVNKSINFIDLMVILVKSIFPVKESMYGNLANVKYF